MINVYDFISIDEVNKAKKSLKSGQTIVIFQDEQRKIKLTKSGRRVYTVIVNYGDKAIENIANDLLVRAS